MLKRLARQIIPQPVRDIMRGGARGPRPEDFPSYAFLQSQMKRYRVENLTGADRADFRRRIEGFLGMVNAEMEGYADPSVQRDLSIKFHWGHDHDFGDFALEGRMRDRHLWVLSVFMDRFGALPRTLEGKRVLDIGAWTGGISMLLHAMGAEIVAVEEVRKYVDALTYLKESFGLDRLHPRNLSLFECTGPEFQDAFDYVLYAGVLYHVTDPVLSLRITFNALKDGGTCLVETAAVDSKRPILTYEGPTVFHRGDKANMNRGGWNWFKPSPLILGRMMEDVGFEQVRTSEMIRARAFAVGTRTRHVDMLRGGLSVRTIR